MLIRESEYETRGGKQTNCGAKLAERSTSPGVGRGFCLCAHWVIPVDLGSVSCFTTRGEGEEKGATRGG